MYPSLEPKQELGVNFALFSEFGKRVNADGLVPTSAEKTGDPAVYATQDRYNMESETIGFNFVSASNTRPLIRDRVFASNLLFRSTLIAGVAGDLATSWFQNKVIHKPANLPPIERNDTLNPADDGLRSLLLGYSGELNYRFYSLSRRADGTRMIPTPLFIGGGYSIATIQNEGFVQLGFRNFDPVPRLFPPSIVSIRLSTMARAGALLPSFVFHELAGYYVTAQASVGLLFCQYIFPIGLEFGITGASGEFLNQSLPRDERDQATPLADGLRERFLAMQVVLGNFAFQTFNDILGGKDKGPTYGASISYVLREGVGWL